MGIIESTLGNAMQRMLMPTEVPDWYAGGRRKTAFPEGPANSLLLIGHFGLQVPDSETARQFYIDALGAGTRKLEAVQDSIIAAAGATEFRLRGGAGGATVGGCEAEPASVWPGHFYIWVADIRRVHEACEALGTKMGCQIVEDVHHVTSDDTIDVLVLQDPFSCNRFVVNQAPKGLVPKMRGLVGVGEDAADAPNLLGVIEVMYLVPSGKSAAAGRFYQHFLGGAAVKKDSGHAVHFSVGDALRQTLFFLEDESHPVGDEGEAAPTSPCTVCMYQPSQAKFQEAFKKCEEEGILLDHTGGWEAAEKSWEFRVKRCVDPTTKSVVMELEHIIRSPEHSECPVKGVIQADSAAAGA
mmetsp:Transcript_52380/g.135175  ORF Transcript_52380/g.135175 Transcript_52380/m.135175 type:complete len:355 (-) Transcript_52380:766-1830(-)